MRRIRIAPSLVLLLLVFARSASAQENPQSPEGFRAALNVRLVLPNGNTFSGFATVRLVTIQGPEVGSSNVDTGGQARFTELVAGEYYVEASSAGFVSVRQSLEISVRQLSANITLVMVPEGGGGGATTAPGAPPVPILAPKARKEVDKAVQSLKQKDFGSARTHLNEAAKLAPNHPDVQFLLGVLEVEDNHPAEAQAHLEKAIQTYPNHVRALELSGELYLQQQQPLKAIPVLEKGAALSTGSWRAHWLLGTAYLQNHEADKAREQAAQALLLGKGEAGQAEILLARALIQLDQRDSAKESLTNFIQWNPDSPSTVQAKKLLEYLERSPTADAWKEALPMGPEPDLGVLASLRATGPNSKTTVWGPPGIDDSVPPVAPNVTCPLPQVLKGVSQRVEELVNNLQRFSATERIEHFTVDSYGERRSPESRGFEYVAVVSVARNGVFQIDEYRNGTLNPAIFPAGIATNGLPGLALIFHPKLVSGFNFVCEGLGHWDGHPVWQVHFAQRLDKPNQIRAYVVAKNYHSIPLKGRVMIDAATFQVLRMETELLKSVPEIGLTQEHVSIDYAPVQFQTGQQQLWLPRTAELYVERNKARYYRMHTFSNFKLFTVGTDQTIHAPKESYAFTNTSNQEISGVLTVTPIPGRSLDQVSIAFKIPPASTVFKVVGPGKDVNIPVDSVDSARFVFTGPPGSIEANAYFVKASTLELVSDTVATVGSKN